MFFPLWCGSLCCLLCFRGFSAVWTRASGVSKAPPSPHFIRLLQRAAVPILQSLIPLQGCWLVSGDHRPAVEVSVKHHIYLFSACHLLTVIRRPLLWLWGVTFLLLLCMELKPLQMIHTRKFLLNQKGLPVFNFLFNVNGALSSIDARAFESYHMLDINLKPC